MDSLVRRLDTVKAATKHVLAKSTTVYLTNRALVKARIRKSKCYFPERLTRLDAVSPVSTLEQWWPKTKSELGVSEAVDNQFVCVICFDPVQPADEIHQIECKHVFHRECLERWYLRDHFDCPLCHRTYFPDERNNLRHETQDYIWLV